MIDQRLFTRLAPLIVFAIIALFLAFGLTKDPRQLPSNLIDRPMPSFSLPDLYHPNQVHTDIELNGDVTLLNVFGSWCPECLVEHPTLLELGTDIRFDLVGLNWRDKRDDATKWLGKHKDPYDYVIFDADSDLAIRLGVTGAPETFIVSYDGAIRYKHVGPLTAQIFSTKLLPVIEALQAERQE